MTKIIRIFISSLFLFFVAAPVFVDTERVSVSSVGVQGDLSSLVPSLSEDGRYVAFQSRASNLVEGDTNGDQDIFVHDRQTGVTERVSVSSSGTQGTIDSSEPSISADGRYVAFESRAYTLVPNDNNGNGDIFVHDRQTGVTELLSGAHAVGAPNRPKISADGRHVAFVSRASLVPDDTNRLRDIFVQDRQTGITQRVSVSSTGAQIKNEDINYYNMSSDGRHVVFSARASNLVAGDTNGHYDVFVHDRQTSLTERVSISSTGEQGNNDSTGLQPGVSADGRYVAFISMASNLAANDTNGHGDVFVHDRQTGQTERISVSSNGAQGNMGSSAPSLSADGRYVSFISEASNLVAGDTNDQADLFVHDRQTGLTERTNVSSSGAQANGSVFSFYPDLSADGRHLAFASIASNLVTNDTNSENDIFVTDNPLANSINNLITVETRLNGKSRETLVDAAQLLTGSLYEVSYIVTNHSTVRLTGVKIFEEGNNLVCNVYALDPGQTKQRARCTAERVVLSGDNHIQSIVRGKVSGFPTYLTNDTDAYYTGNDHASGGLHLTHRINNINADTENQAPTLGSSQASVSFKIENAGNIELYRVKTYHDPANPVNSGWEFKCLIGTLKPGQIRYCKRDMTLSESGLNKALGWAQGKRSFVSPTGSINASNPTYFIVP